MTAPQAELCAAPVRARRRSFNSHRAISHIRLSAEAQTAIRRVAEAAAETSTTDVRLALLWLELARGKSSIVDGFFNRDRCYLILKTRLDGVDRPIGGRRLQILEAVLAGSRQKNIAIDLQLAASTVALNSKLALEGLGVVGKPSRAHPLLMLLARAAGEPVAWVGQTATFMVQDDFELRVVSVTRPDLHLSVSLPSAERAVIRSLVEGHSYQEIARERGTSTRTIANQISAVFRRLQVSGRNELVQRLFQDDCAQRYIRYPGETIVPPGVAHAVTDLAAARRSA